MAFFKGKKESTKETKSPAPKKAAAAEIVPQEPVSESGAGGKGGTEYTGVLLRPHVTEKATDLSGRGVYAFDIHLGANKMQVREAVEKLYKVKPTKVNVLKKKPKLMKNPRTGRIQMKQAGMKKALVYLKEGEKIEFV